MVHALRSSCLRLIGIGVVALLCSASVPNAAVAEGTHVFDPVLSLTGDCSSSPATPLDEIPDPGCPGGNHPKTPFKTQSPRAVVTDFYGNIYVSSPGSKGSNGFPGGKIAIFDSSGNFITEVKDEAEPQAMAVDSKGNLYVVNGYDPREEGLARYEPTGTYNPEEGEIEYDDTPTILVKTETSGSGLAINPLNDHLFRKRNIEIIEYSSAVEGNTIVEKHIGEGKLQLEEAGIAVDAAHGRLYATTWQGKPGEITKVVRVFELAPPHNLIFTLEESEVPGGNIQSSFLSVAADEGTGNFFLYDGEGAKKVYEFAEDGAYLSTIEYPFQYTFRSQIAIDNGKFSPNGALNPTERYLYVPSDPRGSEPTGHSFAFGSPSEGKPIVEAVSFANVGETEAELQALIEPSGVKTHYAFQYLTQQQYEESGESFSSASIAGEGEIPAARSPREVAAAVEGLEPQTRYRFHVIAENSLGTDEGEGEFATFPPEEPFEPCPNDPLRIGFSAVLPDCRGYELASPPITNARSPRGFGYLPAAYFPTPEASPTGGAISFQIEGGIIPGSEGTGSLGGDPYLSTRTEGGWSTADAGPSGSEAPQLVSGSTSPDQGYSFWNTGGGLGSAAIEGKTTFYVRYPDGHSALVGRGTLAADPRAQGRLISQDGGHIIFTSGDGNPAIQLEPNAPPDGTAALYDRTANEVTHVISLLPGDETPKVGEGARYEGSSLDGKGIAFQLAGKLYLRSNNEETYELGEGLTFAGITEGGAKAFYLEGGKLWRFDATTEERTEFSSGAVTPVNIAANGNTAYFVSQSVLTGEPNPNGVTPLGGGENLYRSEEGAISFVGTVTERDVEGESNGIEPVEGLGLWTEKVGEGRLAADPSRTTPDGDALLFESRAVLDGYDPEGHAEVYRYDFSGEELDCLSCNPSLAPASSDASLQSIAAGFGDADFKPLSSFAYVANLRPDGNRAFFQSNEALVPADVDGLQDVYEWEAQDVGSCKHEGGCIYLVSSGHSLRTDYLYGASDSGDDVFFRTGDILLPRDAEETPSIYDARVGGGFAEGSKIPCVVAAECPPPVTPPPNLASPRTPTLGPPDNYRETPCPKGKHRVKRNGKVICVKKKKHPKKHHKKKANKSRRAGK